MMKAFRKVQGNIILAVVLLVTAYGISFAQNEQAGLRTIDGKKIGMNDLRGRITILSFGGTWVPLSSKELPALQKLADRYSPRGVNFYWVSVNNDKPGARNYASDTDLSVFAKKNGLNIKILRDPEMNFYRSLNLDELPTVVLIDESGNIVRKHVGFDWNQSDSYSRVIRDLEELLKPE